ncbi:MAG TPA: HipA family kinase, partial [Candidatus Angelobacter sp.]|nr:HipA family kinase [Candidatus Angelobacter sp.]
MPVEAVQHVRRMRGGAQAHLMRAEDGHFYVVKFQNNPQHLRVLANELLATRLAERIGLPVPVTEIVKVEEWLIANTFELRIDMAGLSSHCKPGLQFGARYVCDPAEGVVFDYLPESMLTRVRNLPAFAGMLVIDKWLGN